MEYKGTIMNKKNIIVLLDDQTRFEGDSLISEIREEHKFNLGLTFYTFVDTNSLSNTFLKIKDIGNSLVFLCLCSDPIFKKIKINSYTREMKNFLHNLKKIDCTPVLLFTYFDCNDIRKRKQRRIEKEIIGICQEMNVNFIRVNLIKKQDFFFIQEGKRILVDKMVSFVNGYKNNKSSHTREIIADRLDPVSIGNTSSSIVLKKSRRIIV
jgi:hypothetical protein